ncbi:MAG: AMP-dependent synthetase and ligase [Ilumatobacteraceae bacterium]|nr:AMP-dependent synthetase and ligase [Ilumatobacteraceae bacterium]
MAVGTLARANIGWFERPDRMLAGVAAAMPWGATTSAALALAAERDPRRAAIVDDDGVVTYRELWRRSDGVAHALRALGAGPDVTVGVLCRNHRGFTDALVGASKTGSNLVLLNTGFAGPQLADVVGAEGISIVIHDDDFAEQAASCAAGTVTIDGSELAAMATSGERATPISHQGRVVILTSGTTGRPKGATRGMGAGAIEGVAGILARIPLRPRDVQVVAAPLFHAWGLSHLMLGFARCATSVVAPRFDAEATLTAVADHRARVLVVVPVMLRRLLGVEPRLLAAADTSALRVIAASGSALGGQLATDVADRFGPVLYNTYGSTEVAVASVAGPADLRRHPTTVGKPAPGATVAILDDAGEPVPAGSVGRIFVGNSARFEGYTGGGGKESRQGLLSSGDVGHIDAEGFLYVDGRDDDMIVSGGENLFPSEVEELLSHHPAISEAAVVGVADEEFGQVLAAFVVRRPGAALDAAGVKEYVRDRLARFKVPKRIEFVDELPRNATGKILKRELAGR